MTAVRCSPVRLPDGTRVPVSVSVGVAHVPDHAAEARELYATADAALYEAKRAGRDRVGLPPGPAPESTAAPASARVHRRPVEARTC